MDNEQTEPTLGEATITLTASAEVIPNPEREND